MVTSYALSCALCLPFASCHCHDKYVQLWPPQPLASAVPHSSCFLSWGSPEAVACRGLASHSTPWMYWAWTKTWWDNGWSWWINTASSPWFLGRDGGLFYKATQSIPGAWSCSCPNQRLRGAGVGFSSFLVSICLILDSSSSESLPNISDLVSDCVFGENLDWDRSPHLKPASLCYVFLWEMFGNYLEVSSSSH